MRWSRYPTHRQRHAAQRESNYRTLDDLKEALLEQLGLSVLHYCLLAGGADLLQVFPPTPLEGDVVHDDLVAVGQEHLDIDALHVTGLLQALSVGGEGLSDLDKHHLDERYDLVQNSACAKYCLVLVYSRQEVDEGYDLQTLQIVASIPIANGFTASVSSQERPARCVCV